MTQKEIIRDLSERSAGAGADQYMTIRCDAARETVRMLREHEKEIKALRKLLDWAVECDFGLDNLGDWWTERFAEEIEGMGYKESLIHLAKRYIEVFEGGEDDD